MCGESGALASSRVAARQDRASAERWSGREENSYRRANAVSEQGRPGGFRIGDWSTCWRVGLWACRLVELWTSRSGRLPMWRAVDLRASPHGGLRQYRRRTCRVRRCSASSMMITRLHLDCRGTRRIQSAWRAGERAGAAWRRSVPNAPLWNGAARPGRVGRSGRKAHPRDPVPPAADRFREARAWGRCSKAPAGGAAHQSLPEISGNPCLGNRSLIASPSSAWMVVSPSAASRRSCRRTSGAK